jgi:methylenetetrahydrofolate reductase (NADPH)
MVHLTEAIKTRQGAFHTYEFFPPRTEAGLVNLLDRIRRLAAKPLPAPIAVSVTWGAGGATADRSLELAEHVVKMGLEVILHLTCTNMPKDRVDQALKVSLRRLRLKSMLMGRNAVNLVSTIFLHYVVIRPDPTNMGSRSMSRRITFNTRTIWSNTSGKSTRILSVSESPDTPPLTPIPKRQIAK